MTGARLSRNVDRVMLEHAICLDVLFTCQFTAYITLFWTK